MTVTYSVTEETFRTESGTRVAYGIAAYAAENTDDTDTPLILVSDITSERECLDALAEVCNRLKLSAVHLRDVVDDFLAR